MLLNKGFFAQLLAGEAITSRSRSAFERAASCLERIRRAPRDADKKELDMKALLITWIVRYVSEKVFPEQIFRSKIQVRSTARDLELWPAKVC